MNGRLMLIGLGSCLALFASAQVNGQWMGTSIPAPVYVISILADGNNIFVGSDSALYLSTDGGSTWVHPANAGLQKNESISALAVDDSFLFAGTQSSGVLRSTDLGTSWQSASTGLPTTQAPALLVRDSVIFAGTDHGVYVSKNEGTSWTAVNAGMANAYVATLVAVPDGAGGFAIIAGSIQVGGTVTPGGVYRSLDLGETWQPINVGLIDSSVYALAVGMSSTIYAGTFERGVYRSTDRGSNWEAMNAGLGSLQVVSLAAVPDGVGDSAVFAGTFRGGSYASTDNGMTWGAFGFAGKLVNALAVNSTSLFAGVVSRSSGGVWRRTIGRPALVGSDDGGVPGRFVLDQNYPNPFNPTTTIGYGLVRRSEVSLKVYNILGELVGDLERGDRSAGFHKVVFDASNLSSGIYFYKLQDGNYTAVKKLMLLK